VDGLGTLRGDSHVATRLSASLRAGLAEPGGEVALLLEPLQRHVHGGTPNPTARARRNVVHDGQRISFFFTQTHDRQQDHQLELA